ncbi:MAG: MarR family transcriptional regulator [Pseudomonadota bacterium]
MKSQRKIAETVVMHILDTAGAFERRLDSALSLSRGITFSEYRLLRSLATADSQGLTRVALANAVSLTPSAVTRALKPLEKLGYVETSKNKRDARQSLASLTSGGRELLSDADGVLQDFYNDVGAAAGRENLESLLGLMARLRA